MLDILSTHVVCSLMSSRCSVFHMQRKKYQIIIVDHLVYLGENKKRNKIIDFIRRDCVVSSLQWREIFNCWNYFVPFAGDVVVVGMFTTHRRTLEIFLIETTTKSVLTFHVFHPTMIWCEIWCLRSTGQRQGNAERRNNIYKESRNR